MTEPRNGMGVTIHVGSDRYPGTIVYVSDSQKIIRVARDSWKMKPREHLGSIQSAVFVPGGHDRRGEEVYTLRRDGRWHLRGTKVREGAVCTIGERSVYFDPHF